MEGMTYMVTGADHGVGFELALGFARQGATVAITSTDAEAARRARIELIARSGNPDIDLFTYQPGTLAATEELAQRIREQYRELHLLVHADVSVTWQPRWTREGFAFNYAYNVLSPYLLTRRLLPLLLESGHASILTMAGEAHREAPLLLEPGRWMYPAPITRSRRQSAMARLLWTYSLSRHFYGHLITANAFSAPELELHLPFAPCPAPEQIARPLLQKAVPDAFHGRTGHYYLGDLSVNSAPITYHRNISRRLVHQLDQLLQLPPLQAAPSVPLERTSGSKV